MESQVSLVPQQLDRLAPEIVASRSLRLREVDYLQLASGIDPYRETVREEGLLARWFRKWEWRLGAVWLKINGEIHYLWPSVDDERVVRFQTRSGT